jgi:hypothetical protein
VAGFSQIWAYKLVGIGLCAEAALILQVVIGTHGRLKNWVSKRLLEVDNINILVFDEADEMLKADAFADDSGGHWERGSLQECQKQGYFCTALCSKVLLCNACCLRVCLYF